MRLFFEFAIDFSDKRDYNNNSVMKRCYEYKRGETNG